MGIFDKKKRSGSFSNAPNKKNSYTWSLPSFLSYGPKTKLDSYIVRHKNVKFHLHLVIDEKCNIGLYMHYKSTPIPKYTYYFENVLGEVMRQHTAYYIPDKTERCGHWYASTMTDMKDFLSPQRRNTNMALCPSDTAASAKSVNKVSDGTLLIQLTFDSDHIATKYQGEFVTFSWAIPRFRTQIINPFTSNAFSVKNMRMALRVDTKREGETVTSYDESRVSEYTFFVFSHLSTVPEHTITVLSRSEYETERGNRPNKNSANDNTATEQNSVNMAQNDTIRSAAEALGTQATNRPNRCALNTQTAAETSEVSSTAAATEFAVESHKLFIIPRERLSDYLIGDEGKQKLIVRASFRIANNPLNELDKLTSMNAEEREMTNLQSVKSEERRQIFTLSMDI